MTGLVLGGGGVRGSYQVGVYLALRKSHIKLDGFTGSSIGAFNAAMLASNRGRELLKFWQTTEIGKVFGFSDELIKLANSDKFDLKIIKAGFNDIVKIIKNKGISTDNLINTVNSLNLEESLFKSKKDFGLVTVRAKDFKPIYVFKEDIKKGKLTDYLMASCYLPIFKMEKLIDDNYYLDGGFYDYAPANALINRGYDKVYVVDLDAIGFRRKYKDKDKVIVIKPSRKLGSIININESRVRENILMGYYDTLKIVKNLDGYKYIFKNKSDSYYRFLIRKVSKKKLKEMQKLFRTINDKKLVLKALEYVMDKENFSYYEVYSSMKVIKKVKKLDKDYGVYNFVKKMQFL